LLAVAYLLVGFGGEISCAEETLAINSSFDVSAVADKSDEGSKKAPEIVEHCLRSGVDVFSKAASVSKSNRDSIAERV
jgi:hypothetical protein